MFVAIVADLHANLEAVQSVFRRIDQRKPDQVCCLGDLTGYNSNPNEVIDIVREREVPTIMGNHDAAVCGLEVPWFFCVSATRAIEWQRERLREDNRQWLAAVPRQIAFDGCCVGVHGSPDCRDGYILDWLDAMRQIECLNAMDKRICLFGHSHKASCFSEERASASTSVSPGTVFSLKPGNHYFLNPGAVGQPRDRDPRAAFAFFDSDKSTFEFSRVEYDLDKCARKIMRAGLPPDLAWRLRKGR